MEQTGIHGLASVAFTSNLVDVKPTALQ